MAHCAGMFPDAFPALILGSIVTGSLFRLLSRLGWGCVCVVVWPVYYLGLVIQWLAWPLPQFLRGTRQTALERTFELGRRLESPPFLDRLRDRARPD